MTNRFGSKSRLFTALAVTGLAAATLFVAPAAHAADNGNCRYDIPTGQLTCFSSFAQVVASINGDHVSSKLKARAFTEAQAVAASADTSYIIGVEYVDANYGGDTLTYTESSPCDTNPDVDFETASMPSGWNDKISSFKSYNNCETKVWQNINYGGDSYGFVGDSTYVGATMNDATSSIQWN